jgi:hypothetical protein
MFDEHVRIHRLLCDPAVVAPCGVLKPVYTRVTVNGTMAKPT